MIWWRIQYLFVNCGSDVSLFMVNREKWLSPKSCSSKYKDY